MPIGYLYDGCGFVLLGVYVVLARPLTARLRASITKLNSDSIVCGFLLVGIRLIVGFDEITVFFWAGVGLAVMRRAWIEDYRETNPTLETLRRRMNIDFILWPEHAKAVLSTVRFPDPLTKAVQKMLAHDTCRSMHLRIKMDQPEPWPVWSIQPAERSLSEYDVGYESSRDPGYFTRNADEYFLSRALEELCSVNSIMYRWYWCTGTLSTTRRTMASILRSDFTFHFRDVMLDAATQYEVSILSSVNGAAVITLVYEHGDVQCYGDQELIGACGVQELVTVIPVPQPSA